MRAVSSRIAILGAGRLGESLLRGFLSSGWRDPSDLVATSRRPERVAELKERYGPRGEGGRVTHLDGVSVDFDDWHFNVRPSNTEPLLRLNLEAYTAAEMEQRRDEVLGLIRS